MPSTFTIRNTGNASLEVEQKGEGSGGQQGRAQQQRGELAPGEERTFTVDQNSHVQIREGERSGQAQPKR